MHARPTRSLLGLLLTAALLAAALAAPATVHAAGSLITVNTLADSNVAGDGKCSLREAIVAANLNLGNTNNDCPDGQGGEHDQIVFSVAGAIVLGSNLPAVTGPVSITGEGQVTIDGDDVHQVFRVESTGSLNLRTLTIQDGFAGGPFGFGGALASGGSAVVWESTIRSSRATYGAAVHNNGSMAIFGSTIEGNAASDAGGAVYNEGTLTVRNSTITRNTAPQGAGIYSTGTATLAHVTIARNTANTGGGGGVKRAAGSMGIYNSVLTGNVGNQTAGSPDRAYSVIKASADGIIDTALRDNGGPTKTIRLPAGSPALSVGDPDWCAFAEHVDQRRLARPAGALLKCDAGAVQRDRGKPVVVNKPVVDLEPDRSLKDGRIAIRLIWVFRDTGIGIERFTLQRQVNGGDWTTVSTTLKRYATGPDGLAEGRYYPYFTSGKAYRFRVRAIDEDGNASDWAYSPTRTARLIQQSSSAIRYSTGWSTGTSTKYSGGSVKYATTVGRWVEYTYTGRDINLLTTWRPTPFQFKGYINGDLITTDSKYADPTVYQRQVFVYRRAASETRTLRIVVDAAARLDIDGFVVLR